MEDFFNIELVLGKKRCGGTDCALYNYKKTVA